MSLDEDDPPFRWRQFFTDLREAARSGRSYREASTLLRALIVRVERLSYDVERLSERLTYVERPDFDRNAGVGVFPRDPASQTEPERMRVREETPTKRMTRKRRKP